MDAEFIPASIAVSPDALRVEELGVVQWRTVVDALPGASLFGVSAEGVNLSFGGSHFDGGWLAGAMALLATRPELLVHLFALTDHLDRGILTLRIFKHGTWIPITIDAMLPCGPDGKVAFCSSAAADELWPALLTKAMAKLYGSYAALDGGDLVDALIDLSAGHVALDEMPQAPAESQGAPSLEELGAELDRLWRQMSRTQRKRGLQGLLTLPGSSAAPLLPRMMYPILQCREPMPGLRLLCVRDPYVDAHGLNHTGSAAPFTHAWGPHSNEWQRFPAVAEELLPLSEGLSAFWIPMAEAAARFASVLTLTVAGHTTEAVVCEGAWREGNAGGPRTQPSWCINPMYWLTVSASASVSIELSQRDARLPDVRHASTSAANFSFGGGAPPALGGEAVGGSASGFGGDESGGGDEDGGGAEDGGGGAKDGSGGAEDGGGGSSYRYLPIMLSVLKGGALSTLDYGRMWTGDDKLVVGESGPSKRRSVGLTLSLHEDRVYCIVPCSKPNASAPYILRIQADVPFSLKQAQPAVAATLHGRFDESTSGGPRTCKTWHLNPQYWLTLRPPPTNAAMARVRVVVEAHAPATAPSGPLAGTNDENAGGAKRGKHQMTKLAPPSVGFSLFKGEFERGKFGKRGGGGSSASASSTASPPPSRPGTAPAPTRPGSPPPRSRPASSQPGGRHGQQQGGGGAKRNLPAQLMTVGGPEQLVEFGGLERNHDGPVSKGGGSQGASSTRAELASISEMQISEMQISERQPPPPVNGRPQYASASFSGSLMDQQGLLPAAGPQPLADGSTLDLNPIGSYNVAFGIPVRDTFDSRPVRRHAPTPTELVSSCVAEESVGGSLLKLDPGVPYLLAVHTAKPGEQCEYTLSVFSDAVISLREIEPHTSRVLGGKWGKSSAGGSHIEGGAWSRNPQYGLMLAAPTTVDITLERPPKKWERMLKTNTLASLMGLYVLRGEHQHTPVRSPQAALAAMIHQANFCPMHELKCTLYLEPLPNGAPYILMPATFGEGMCGPFSLGVTTADGAPIEIALLDDEGGRHLRDARD